MMAQFSAVSAPNALDEGRCVMRGACGRSESGILPLPCPYDGPPQELDSVARETLVSVCGPEWAEGPTCCDADQLETLAANMKQVETLIGSCPACRNNFHDFFCSFTCSPRQADFLNVTATQTTSEGKTGLKSINFHVSPTYGTGFYDSCKGVQAGSAFAMDFIGGGAKDYSGFFRFLGQEKDDGLGSPFRIDFPASAPEGLGQLDQRARNCADDDLANRCTCVDCPQVCTALPPVAPPGTEATCHIGRMSCLTFTLTVGYALALAGFVLGFFALRAYRARREQSLRRLAPSASSDTPLETPLSPRAPTLIGASSLALGHDGVDSLGTLSERQLGRGAALLDPTEAAQPRQYRLNTLLRRGFYRLGLGAAGAPWRTFALVFAATALLNAGWARFQIETDPVRLWVSPSSDSKLRKDFFDDNFGPFFRTQQIFITAEPSRWTYQGETDLVSATATQEPVLSYERLKFWFEVEADIRALTSPNGDQLTDLCYKPLGEEGACVVQSVTQWYGNDFAEVDPDTWQEHLVACASEPVNCLPEFLQPLQPKFVLGGYPRNADDKPDYLDAKAMVATYVVANSNNKTELARIESWEVVLREYLQGLQERASAEAGLHIAFRTEIAIEEELNKSTNMDIRTVVLSYIAMFFYVALTLGSGGARGGESLVGSLVRWARNFPRLFQRRSVATASFTDDPLDQPTWLPRIPRRLFVDSKFLLGLFGIALVVLSVSSSVGFFSALGVKVTLIIAEVIPFLVLAVGVDNVFILVNELDRQNLLHGPGAGASATMPGGLASPPARGASLDDGAEVQSMRTALSPEERVARALAKMGPSILLSTVTETLAFALGALVPMPAVRNFALYAAGSVLLNAFLQCTVFVAALALDLRRVEAGRVDCLPCLRVQSRIALLDAPARGGMGRMARFIRRRYAPWLLSPVVKTCVLAFFGGLFIASVISIQHIELGLDQRQALPPDSFLVDYFDKMDTYYEVGPPVYFVSQGVNVTKREGQQQLCARFTSCSEFSLLNVLEAERQRPESSFIPEPTAPWIDDFMNWLNPNLESCCRVRKTRQGEPTEEFCGPDDSPRRCMSCFEGREPGWNVTMRGLPEGAEFMRYLKQWLVSPTTQDCPLAGAAQFGQALALTPDDAGVTASHFRTYHTPLKTQADFINAFDAAHRIAADISTRTGVEVFPYSIFYVYFDQYAHVVAITQELLGLGLAAVLIVTAIFLGSWRTGTIVAGVVALTVTSCMGAMGVWGVSLNALSVVNLVISLGIAVEFCAHIARAFMSAGAGLPADHPAGQKERDERMYTALVDVGPSVLSGITFTKLIGISVLALTRSKLLEIYYFRMWFSLIVAGALHGLVLLPVVLSIAGGPGYPFQEADEEWMSQAMRDDYEYAPFLADDDSVHSI